MSLVDQFADFVGSVPYRDTTLPWGKAQVWDLGQGRPVVLLHGIAGGRRIFYRQARLLAQTRRVIVPPLRGEDIAATDRSPEPYVDDLCALLDLLDLNEASLLGVSFGGYLALACAARNPPRVAEVIVQGGFCRYRLRLGDRMALRVSQLLPDAFGSLYFRRRVLRGSESRILRQRAPGLETLVADWLGKTPFASLRARTRMISEHDLAGRLAGIRLPLTIAHGGQDGVVPWGLYEQLQRLCPDARSVQWEDAGHLVPLTHPEQLAATLRVPPCA